MFDTKLAAASERNTFELCFQSLFDEGLALIFPCDAAGCVDLDALSERARINYFSARATVGRDYSIPRVQHGLH
ncbi:MAG: hypothetical protein WA210_19165 [Burkholderiaceae bacterium]